MTGDPLKTPIVTGNSNSRTASAGKMGKILAYFGLPESKTNIKTEASNTSQGTQDTQGSSQRKGWLTRLAPSRASNNTLSTAPSFNRAISGVFLENVPRPHFSIKLPRLGKRIKRTEQLVYCISLLLQDSLSPAAVLGGDVASDTALFLQESTLNKAELDWLEEIKKDPMEQDRLHWLLTQMVEVFVVSTTKDSVAIAEIVALGPVMQKEPYRKLLSALIGEFEAAILLHVDLLQGLVELVQSASSDYLVSDDLVKIFSILRVRLHDTRQQSTEDPFHLTLAVSRILDVMADHKVLNLDRIVEHEPLAGVLSGLRSSSDPFLLYQASYAFQAQKYVRDDKTILQTLLRYSTGMMGDLVNTSGPIIFDLSELLRVLADVQKTMNKTLEPVESSFEGTLSLIDGGRGVFDSFREGFGSEHKQLWYPAIRAAYALVQTGQLRDLNAFIVEAPCRRDPFFQWGICQLLGEIAVNPAWAVSTRQQVITLLGHLFKVDRDWGRDESVRAWILTIVTKLGANSEHAVNTAAWALLQDLKQDQCASIQHPYPLTTHLPIPASSPILTKVHINTSIEYDLHVLRLQRLKDAHLPVYIPPMAKANLQASDGNLFPLMEKVQEFLASDRQVMLILGDSGSGKSTFNKHFEQFLWTEYKEGNPIPLFIDLPAIERPEKELIIKQLKNYNFSGDQIRELKEHRRFVVICDGYDESQLNVNLHTSNFFNQPDQWDVKLVISCRNQYLGQDYHDRFVPRGTGLYNQVSLDLFQEAAIASFSKQQIQEFVKQFVPLEPRTWTTQDYMDKLTTIPNLMDLVKNPFLLSLCLEALPKVTEGRLDLSTIKISRVQLYDTFVDHWLDVNKRRLQGNVLSKEDKATLDEILDAGFVTMGLEFSTRLASAIFEQQMGNPIVQYVHRSDKNSWKAEFFGPEPGIRMLLRSLPLTRIGNQFHFVHRSMLEYFLSRAIFDPNDHDRQGDLDFPMHHNHVFGAADAPLSVANSPLSRGSLISEPSVIQFLCDRVQQSLSFKQQLLAIIEQSKTNPEASQAAANAVSILFKSDVRLNGIDMRGARIPGADLSGGELDSAQLQGADLTDVNFSRSWLRQTDFSKATMSGAQFGEWPFLKVDMEPTACAYSNDGSSLAIGLSKGGIILYDTATWKCTFTFSGHLKAITVIAFSPTEHQLLSASRDNTWRVWDLNNIEPARIRGGHGGIVTGIAVSLDGLQLATSGADKLIRLWDSQTLQQVKDLQGHSEVVTCLAFSLDGSMLISGSNDKSLRLWDTSGGCTRLILQGHSNNVSSVAFAPNGNFIVSGSFDTTVRVWAVSTGEPLAVLSNHTDRVSAVAHSGQYILSASWDKTVRVWNTITYAQISVLRGATKIITSLSVSPRGLQQIAACSNDKTVRLWDATPSLSDAFSSGTLLEGANSNVHTAGISTMAISADGQRLVTGGYDATVRTCDASNGGSIGAPLRVHTRAVAAVAFSPGDRILASSSWDHTLRLWSNWDIEWCEQGEIIHGHQAIITCLTFLPSGQLVSGSADRTIRLWDVDTRSNAGMFHGHTRGVRSVACSPDGSMIASGSDDRTVRIWNTQTQELESVFNGHAAAVACVAISPTGNQIASASEDKTIRLWDPPSTASEPTVLHGHQGGVQCVAYSPCGRFLASGSDDNTSIIWNTSSGNCLAIIGEVFGGVSSIVWTEKAGRRDGGKNELGFVIGCKDGSIRAWRLLVERDKAQVQLEWGTGFGHLVATQARISGAQGLSSVVRELLMQRGAVEERAEQPN